MAKKGNRIQVIMECTEQKTSGVPELQDTLLPKTGRILLNVWRKRNTILT